jgi:peptidyl-prolyl cis-trans isomerase A (cyclophilin A)
MKSLSLLHRSTLIALALAFSQAALAKNTSSKENGQFMADIKQGKDLYATLDTSLGVVVVKLFSRDAPKTVVNFVSLADGSKSWTDPKTGKASQKPLYDGTIFHRVIPNFMIQGGDPLGNGTGDPGYKFEDELQSSRTFDKAGILAMANSGPNSNGSQFFITVVPTPWLNGHHTIFGEVVKGMDVVNQIVSTPTGPGDRPKTAVVLKKVTVSEQPPQG